MRLQGKVALITGAAMGDKEGLMGIGGAAAWLFVREGAKGGRNRHRRCPGREDCSPDQ